MKNLLLKIKSIKHIELYIALILIILAIIIYFSLTDKNIENNGQFEQNELEVALSKIDGVGECDVLVMYDNKKSPYAALVVCEGGNNIKVVEKVTVTLKTLLNIDSKYIKVYKTK